MIISHKHRYVFVEVPRTGSTAISAELRENYDGEPILKKHSYYSTFLGSATDDERNYRVISGIRNPLDDAVSRYRKLCTHDESFYDDSRRSVRRHRYVNQDGASFSGFLHKFHKIPFDLWTSTYHSEFDYVIRFENLVEDFDAAIRMLGLDPVRPLPRKNMTDRKKNFESYYTPKDYAKAAWVFGPYMEKWGYELPDSWGIDSIPQSSRLMFRVLAGPRRVYWNKVRQGDSVGAGLIRKLIYE